MLRQSETFIIQLLDKENELFHLKTDLKFHMQIYVLKFGKNI